MRAPTAINPARPPGWYAWGMIEAPTTRGGSPSTGLRGRRRYLPSFGRRRHKMTRAGLRNLARSRSGAVADLVARRAACRPRNDAVIRAHEYDHRRVTLHDLETRSIYLNEHLAGISDLREQFAGRGIRSRELDRYLASPENEADLRTISTALLEMSSRLGR